MLGVRCHTHKLGTDQGYRVEMIAWFVEPLAASLSPPTTNTAAAARLLWTNTHPLPKALLIPAQQYQPRQHLPPDDPRSTRDFLCGEC
jgi:hypothetical protein